MKKYQALFFNALCKLSTIDLVNNRKKTSVMFYIYIHIVLYVNACSTMW